MNLVVVDPPVAPDPHGASHRPVLLDEVLALLEIRDGSLVVDGTLGGGGHTHAILQRSAPHGKVLGMDADPAAVRRTQRLLASDVEGGRLLIVRCSFDAMETTARTYGFDHVDSVLLDLGVSSFQLQTPERGFSFASDGPLDMRFDPASSPSAAEIVNTWGEGEIADLIYRYGEEHRGRTIARAIVRSRPLQTTAELAAVVERAVGGRRGSRIHPATRTFQALRIAVNRELEQLEETLPQALRILKPGGRLAVISFHSLEDRIVKQWMVQEARTWTPDPLHPQGGTPHQPALRLVTRKPVTASEREQQENPRSRSAKLRVAEKV